MSRILAAAVLVVTAAEGHPVRAAGVPQPAAFRSAFEAQFPKTAATASALEVESLAASLGIELSPREPLPRDASEPDLEPPETKALRSPALPAVLAAQQALPSPGAFLDREVKTQQERIGAAPPALESYLADHEAEIAAIRSVLLRGDVAWEFDPEFDATRGEMRTYPNLVGILRLQRLLLSQTLLEVRAGKSDLALQTLEASWNLNGSLRGRPELTSHLIAIAVARLQAGVLRKIDAPAYGWADRLRSGSVLAGVLAAFQNEVWLLAHPPSDLTGPDGAFGRILRRVAEALRGADLCSWTSESLQRAAAEASRAEAEKSDEIWLAEIAMPNLLEALIRARRYEVDAELTALIVDARLERDASRRRRWPARLLSVGRGVCSDQKWSYRTMDDGRARFAFEGNLGEADSTALRLPLEFVAGKTWPRVRRPRGLRRARPAGTASDSPAL